MTAPTDRRATPLRLPYVKVTRPRRQMTRRLIVNNFTAAPDALVLRRVAVIVLDGLVSTTGRVRHYCHLTTYTDGMVIQCSPRTATTFVFRVSWDDAHSAKAAA